MRPNNLSSSFFSRISLGIICVLIVFSPLVRGAVHPWAFTLIQTGVVLAAICLVLESLTQPGGGLSRILLDAPPLTKPLIAILLLCLVSFAASDYKPFAQEGLFMLLIYGAAYLITISCVRTRKEQRLLIWVIILTAVLLSLIGLLKRFDILTFTWWRYPEVGPDHGAASVSGPYVNRNHLAGFLEMAIPLLLALFFTGQRTSEAKLGMVFLALFLLTTQAFTLSRGGWLSTISAVFFMAAVLLTQKKFVQKKNFVATGFGVLVISLFILSSLPVVERITTLTQQDQADNLSGRIRCWKGVVNGIKDNLLFGIGPDTFTEAYPAYQIPGNAVLRRYAHNDYLHFMSETGILFVPVLAFALIWFFRSGFQRLKSRSRQDKGVALGVMAGVFAILIHSLSDFNLNIPANAFAFTVLAGAIRNPDK